MYKEIDTSALEELIVSESIGSNPGIVNHDSLNIKCNKFVDWCFKSADIKKNLQEKAQIDWDGKSNWLEYYKGYLIKHIRDMKLNNLLN